MPPNAFRASALAALASSPSPDQPHRLAIEVVFDLRVKLALDGRASEVRDDAAPEAAGHVRRS